MNEEIIKPIEQHLVVEDRKYILTPLGLELCLIPTEQIEVSQILQDIEQLSLPEDFFYVTQPLKDILNT